MPETRSPLPDQMFMRGGLRFILELGWRFAVACPTLLSNLAWWWQIRPAKNSHGGKRHDHAP
jgi:hypothetical protein